MKIAVVGCGAVGSFYGSKLARSGQTVHFLLRSDFDVVRRNGVSIRSPHGDYVARPKCARSPEEIGRCDLVIVALKSTANDSFPELLGPLVSDGTAIITLQNGLGNEEQLARSFPVEQILGGLCFVCLNRIAPGQILHIAHGKVVIGEFQRWPEPRTHEIAEMFRHSGVPCAVAADLEQAHWEKLVWNIPFNGLGVAGAAGYDLLAVAAEAARKMQKESDSREQAVDLPNSSAPFSVGGCLTTEMLLTDARWEQVVRELMLEIIAVARAKKFAIPDELAADQIERTRSMGHYKASTLIDFERKLPLELNSLFLEPLRQARRAGIKAVWLEALCAVLERLEVNGTGVN
jgi:2-dehydropantoate 2-reductase